MKETDQVYMHIPLWVQTYENEDGRMVPSVVHFNKESYKVMGPPLSVHRIQGLESLGMDYVEYTVMIAVKPGSRAARKKRLISGRSVRIGRIITLRNITGALFRSISS